MLEARGLVKEFRRRNVVDHVTFELRRGEVTGYLGPNGAGKSTTVKMLTGLLEPTEGEILFHGRNIRKDLVGFRHRLGYVPEEPNVYGYLSGLEYLQLVGGLRGLATTLVDRRVNALLDLLYLRDASWAPVASYSKRMKQRVLIAAALLHDPDVLIFDEAQSGLDVQNALLFQRLLRALADRGKAILYISHVLELVEKVCDRVMVMYGGRIVADDAVHALREMMQAPTLEQVFRKLARQDDMEERARQIVSAIVA